MDLPPLTYLSVDSMSEGVGASQVLPYVGALSGRGMAVTLHSLEKAPPSPAIADRLDGAGVVWRPHKWGRGGSTAGLARLVRGAAYLRGAELVHARSDIPAGSALLARCPAWVWDMRGFWADERIAVGSLRPGSVQDRIMRMIERGSARRAGAIVTLTAAAIDVLERRHGPAIREKARVITTCVDLDRFALSPPPLAPPLRLLLAGTLSARYDVPLMLRLVEELGRRRPTILTALVPQPSPWDQLLRQAGVQLRAASVSAMPGEVAASHVGLCVLRLDGGVSMRASMPTKIGEFLASGRPVVVNAGLGDLDELLAKDDCGTILADASAGELARAADEIERLVDDPEAPRRCRRLAEAHFDLESGIQTLIKTYRAVTQAIS
jgi:glycosyltransferase involved in cell wall biosynthesis